MVGNIVLFEALIDAGSAAISWFDALLGSETNTITEDKTNEADPYARPGQKKQGRERKNKARQSKDWKPRSTPKPLKKHTPGRDHRKYK